MCGIAGYVQRAASDDDLIDRMTDRLAHRGPDGRSTWRGSFGDWSIALGHRRLSIIDPAGGRQPMENKDGSMQIVYNGEIYNFQSLRETLSAGGHRFVTRSDTEVILHHFEERETEGLAGLDGMFALAIWDQHAGRLVLARDRIGIKPLYYASLPDGGIAFASELMALLQHPDVDRSLDPDGVASFFFQDYVHPPHTIVRGARKLDPAHFLSWSDGNIASPKRFWSLRIESCKPPNLADTLRIKLHTAVKLQLVSDVPVGVFLSGGIDSSVVAALAQQHSACRLKTFTIRFDDPQFDESMHARRVADFIGAEHVEESFTENSLLENLEQALRYLDEPMADPSILPTFMLSRLASSHVKVALSGDGGDELWAGYPTCRAHRMAAVYQLLPKFFRQAVVERIVRALPVRKGYQRFEWKAKRFALRWDDDRLLRHLRWMSNLDTTEVGEAIPRLGCLPLAAMGPSSSELHGLNDILALDLRTYLPGSVLTKVDRASMAHGLEVRPPLLSNDLVDFAFSLDASYKLKRFTGKAILKQAVIGLLPNQIIHRRKKGFAIPLARWLRGPLKERLEAIIANSPLWGSPILDRSVFGRWMVDHQQLRRDRSRPLYALMVLDDWYRRLSLIEAQIPSKEKRYA